MESTKKKSPLERAPVVTLTALLCCFLWGSAFPGIKTGYRLLAIASDDSGAQLLFAGVRFMLAGVFVVLLGSLRARRFLALRKSAVPRALVLAATQTVGQYIFFYIGLAHASGVRCSIVGASESFLCILLAAVLFRREALTGRKLLGCALGFAGVVLVNVWGHAGNLAGGVSFLGEGFIFLSCISAALAVVFIREFGRFEDPVALSGWQFFIGGAVLAAVGAVMGGRVSFAASPAGTGLLFYLALVSCTAYTLWSLLLQVNPVSRIAIYGFMTPVFGVVLSGLLLGEGAQAFSPVSLLALILVSAGIIIVNRDVPEKAQ